MRESFYETEDSLLFCQYNLCSIQTHFAAKQLSD